MIISLTYEVNMAHLNIQLTGVAYTIKIKTATVEEDASTGMLVAKDDQGKLIGKFPLKGIIGWWLE
ncbi:MAG TPA: hypothetical protein VGQ12_05030 [Candidatus Angelobacter sp.]|jgi:hypothetical protein|nr:hypothetical protein [Candidatus Angelobacter sp.]